MAKKKTVGKPNNIVAILMAAQSEIEAICDNNVALSDEEKELITDILFTAEEDICEALEDADYLISALRDYSLDSTQEKKLLEHIGEQAVIDWLEEKDMKVVDEGAGILIKCKNIDQLHRIKDFCETEIYPHYNDHDKIELL